MRRLPVIGLQPAAQAACRASSRAGAVSKASSCQPSRVAPLPVQPARVSRRRLRARRPEQPTLTSSSMMAATDRRTSHSRPPGNRGNLTGAIRPRAIPILHTSFRARGPAPFFLTRTPSCFDHRHVGAVLPKAGIPHKCIGVAARPETRRPLLQCLHVAVSSKHVIGFDGSNKAGHPHGFERRDFILPYFSRPRSPI